ncbi:MAG TPA: bifunctional hydroxymethylpyrimidine kinase/phosphomethylpyrimidine kinase [Acidimicrobiales bacterium]|nr:bifunctional hydroxymethylpyrimidine kinase/phosphomethylpyrimidine kinase [Acidimicrobiales bacterium]
MSGRTPGTTTPPVALTIAGSDSGGGAGIAADLKTFAAHGVFGTMAITAVTAQDTAKVHGVVVLEPEEVALQIDAVLGDFHVGAAKTGMLATLPIVEMLAERAAAGRLPPLVVDPVMIASSGAELIEGDSRSAYKRLLPYALVTTPNLAEAEFLLGREIRDLPAMRDAARALCDLGVAVAVVKGGHLAGPRSVDVVCGGGELVELSDEKVETRNVHGTGCTLSAAIAANLSLGLPVAAAIAGAKRYVAQVIRRSAAWELGAGPGPLDHFGPRVGRLTGRHPR